MGMGVLGRLRPSPIARLLKDNPTLVVQAAVGAGQVEQQVRRWCPAAVRQDNATVLLGETLEFHGPVGHDEDIWRKASLPREGAAAYALTGPSGAIFGGSDPTGYELLAGLCRRLGWQWRERAGKPWQDRPETPADPCVLGPRTLPVDELVRLLTSTLGELEPAFIDEDTGEYGLDAPGIVVELHVESVPAYPLVRAQPWFASRERPVGYDLVSDGTRDAWLRAAAAAAVLAEAAAGVLLDENGFPWEV
jgi:hypothetical protein